MALKQALRADLPSIVDIWVDAFASDPFQRWIEPDDTRWPAYGGAWMAFVAGLTFERGHTLFDDDLGVAVAWVPPDLSLIAPDDLERGRSIMATHVGEARTDEALATILTAWGHDLEQPHWTLQYLGVRAAARSRGIGATAVTPGLAACDRDGLPCGLVSTNPRNLSFYERHGFTLAAEVPTPDGTAVLRPMHRAPGSDR